MPRPSLPSYILFPNKPVFLKPKWADPGSPGSRVRGADKRIDVLATAIKGDLAIYDLPELELAYAPPFSSAKDPVNMLGYVAQNIQDGALEAFQWHEVEKLQGSSVFLLDVLEKKEIKSKEAKLHEIILYNDDYNTFDHVIETLIVACDHVPEQAEQCALLVHYKGKCSVKTGTYKDLEPRCGKLLEKGLTAEIV